MTGGALRKCPTCLTEVEPMQLGFRDYRFLGDALPGKIAPMDFDMVLERHGSVLIVELKPKGVAIGKGQQLTYKTMAGMGCDVWLVQGDWDADMVAWARMTKAGRWADRKSITPEQFKEMIAEWWTTH